MTIEKVKSTNYDLQTFSGDSGSIRINNIPTDSNDYVAYIEIKGKTTIIKSVELNGADNCTFRFTPDETKALGVGKYEYGIKICKKNTDEENTYIPDLRIGEKASFIVYPERAAGTNG